MTKRLVLGIRKELKNKWERRVPLVPAAVKKLTQEGTTVLVQPSRNRIFPNEAFQQVIFPNLNIGWSYNYRGFIGCRCHTRYLITSDLRRKGNTSPSASAKQDVYVFLTYSQGPVI